MSVDDRVKQMLTWPGVSPERALLAACSFWYHEDFMIYLPYFADSATTDMDKISNEHKAVICYVLSLCKKHVMYKPLQTK
jgi:hypothetical protein